MVGFKFNIRMSHKFDICILANIGLTAILCRPVAKIARNLTAPHCTFPIKFHLIYIYFNKMHKDSKCFCHSQTQCRETDNI